MSLIYTIFGYPLGWIMWACFKVLPIYGVALVLFTLIVRVCLVPLSIKQQKSMGKNADFPAAYGGNTEKIREQP